MVIFIKNNTMLIKKNQQYSQFKTQETSFFKKIFHEPYWFSYHIVYTIYCRELYYKHFAFIIRQPEEKILLLKRRKENLFLKNTYLTYTFLDLTITFQAFCFVLICEQEKKRYFLSWTYYIYSSQLLIWNS